MGTGEARLISGVCTVFLLLAALSGPLFSVPAVQAQEAIYILFDGRIYPPTAPITTTDGVTYAFLDNISSEIVVQRNDIIIDGNGYTLQAPKVESHAYPYSPMGIGFCLRGVSNVTIENTTIADFAYGIWLDFSSDNTLYGNNATDNGYGILVESSSNNTLSSNNVTANKAYLHGSWGGEGICLQSSFNNTLISNAVTANIEVGVHLVVSSDNTLRNNDVANNTDGIALSFSSDNILSGNTITANSGIGIYLSSSTNNTLSENFMESNGGNLGVVGTVVNDFMNSLDTSNIVDGKRVYYLMNRSDEVITPETYPETGYLALINCTNMTTQGLSLTHNVQGILMACTNNSKIIDNNFANNTYGIELVCSSNNTLSGNNATANDRGGIELNSCSNSALSVNHITANNGDGIGLCSSSNNSISVNNIANNDYGISLDSSSNISISGNCITANDDGIDLFGSSNITVCGNNVTKNGRGICLDVSSYNSISRNSVVANEVAGVWLEYSSNNNSVSGNNVTGIIYRSYGVRLYFSSGNSIAENNIADNRYGIIDGPYDYWYYWSSSGNSIYHNNFLNNTNQVYAGSANIWDDGYPPGGNYWSDYNGTDANHDGIGDTPYIIDANNIDHYPLTNVIPEFPSFLILPMFFIATLLAVIIHRRKHTSPLDRG